MYGGHLEVISAMRKNKQSERNTKCGGEEPVILSYVSLKRNHLSQGLKAVWEIHMEREE